MRFTDMHSSSAVCTPSRYSILTGRYPWRSTLKKGALSGYAPSLIDAGRLTVAGFLKRAGYYTAGVGKWHLGLGTDKKTDYSKPFHPAPTDHGFDYFYGLPASLDMPPYLYFENDHAVAAPTAHTDTHGKDTAPLGVFWRGGDMMPGFDFPQVVPTLTDKAVDIVNHRAKEKNPFFLYFALPSPHNPWLPLPEYKGKSRAGDYGDYVYETDAMVGKVLTALEDNGIADNTLVVFASDNGAPWDDENINRYEHRANADWRGRKSDVWEGGHRIPCLMKWPGHIAPGSVSNEMASLTDFMATVAAALNLPLPDDAAEDSFNMLPALEQRNTSPIRKTMVDASGKGMLCIREGSWKLEMGLGSGGFTEPMSVDPVPGGPQGQLYDLSVDPGEQHNVWSEHPDIVDRLTRELKKAEADGRTRPAHF
jgi:arylsulfatase A-like enzyme